MYVYNTAGLYTFIYMYLKIMSMWYFLSTISALVYPSIITLKVANLFVQIQYTFGVRTMELVTLKVANLFVQIQYTFGVRTMELVTCVHCCTYCM